MSIEWLRIAFQQPRILDYSMLLSQEWRAVTECSLQQFIERLDRDIRKRAKQLHALEQLAHFKTKNANLIQQQLSSPVLPIPKPSKVLSIVDFDAQLKAFGMIDVVPVKVTDAITVDGTADDIATGIVEVNISEASIAVMDLDPPAVLDRLPTVMEIDDIPEITRLDSANVGLELGAGFEL